MHRLIFPARANAPLDSSDALALALRQAPVPGWPGLLCMLICLAGALAWGFLGCIQVSVEGEGMLLRPGGAFTVTAPAGGVLAGLPNLHAGDAITAGQLLGRLPQPVLEVQVAALREQARALPLRMPYDQAEHARLFGRIQELQARLRAESRIPSPRAGRVIEVMARNGDSLRPGDPLVSIEQAGEGIEAMLYLPAGSQVKQLRPGMAVALSPADAPRQRYGVLRGRVLSVSAYPATEAGMLTVYRHAGLVTSLTRDGPVHSVAVMLERDAASRSGYAWSKTAGMALDVSSGTRVSGSVVLAQMRPVDLLLSLLDRQAGY